MQNREQQTVDVLYGGLPPNLRVGEYDEQGRSILKWGIGSALIAALLVCSFPISLFFTLPMAATVIISALFTGGFVHLCGLAYGILNDMIATRANLPYFILGHQPGQRGLIKSNKPNAQAVAWGINATWGLTFLASSLFVVATLITGFLGFPFAGFILPLIPIAMSLAIGGAHLFGNFLAKKILYTKNKKFKGDIFSPYRDEYQNERLEYWHEPNHEQSILNHTTNGIRNGFGYVVMPLLGAGALAGIIYSSVLSNAVPAFLFGAAFSAFPLIGVGIVLAIGIVAACFYLYKNHNKVVDSNPYRLDYPEPTLSAVPLEDDNENNPTQSPKTEPAVGDTTKDVMQQLAMSDTAANEENLTVAHAPNLVYQAEPHVIVQEQTALLEHDTDIDADTFSKLSIGR